MSLEVCGFGRPSLSESLRACGKVHVQVSALSASAMCVSGNISEHVCQGVWEMSVCARVCVRVHSHVHTCTVPAGLPG